MNIDSIRAIVESAIKAIPGATAQLPMGVWDNGAGSMGIEIKQPQLRAGTACELTASIVLTKREQTSPELVRQKIKAAVAAIIQDVQIVIRPLPVPKFDARRERVVLPAGTVTMESQITDGKQLLRGEGPH